MSDTELLIKEIKTLPTDYVTEVLDFVGYLKQKHSQGENGDCPLDHTPNAVTIAAMQEVQDMIDGKAAQKSYHSLDEMLEALNG
jgi:hypothetical protein